MIQTQTILNVVDNSGGKAVKCIKLLKKGNNPKKAFVGDIIVVSVQKIRTKNRLTSKVRRGEVIYAIIVKTKRKFKRTTGITFGFDTNSVVLLSKQKQPFGSRVFGSVSRELRQKKFSKIASLANNEI